MLCYVMLCYVMLCYVMLCYVMLCYVMLYVVMLCYVMSIFFCWCSLLKFSRNNLGRLEKVMKTMESQIKFQIN